MHNISKCKTCYQRKGGECEAYNDMRNPILNENKECQGAIYRKSEYEQLQMELEERAKVGNL